jgi:hypothetical protein
MVFAGTVGRNEVVLPVFGSSPISLKKKGPPIQRDEGSTVCFPGAFAIIHIHRILIDSTFDTRC